MRRPCPSLHDLCFRTLLRHLNLLEDVGDLDERVLQRVLGFCNESQLRRIERGTQGRDLRALVDPEWKRLFLGRFGTAKTEGTIGWMRQNKLLFSWRRLYDAQEEKEAETAREITERCRKLEEEKPQVKVLPTSASSALGKRKMSSSRSIGSGVSVIKRAKTQISNSLNGSVLAGLRKRQTKPMDQSQAAISTSIQRKW